MELGGALMGDAREHGLGMRGAAALDRASILIVDDHVENIVALRSVLQRDDYEIVTAQSGSEALRKVLKHDFAVILLDVLMPGMDGFQTARLIRERDRSRSIPILFLTATGADVGMIDRAYSVGAVDYLIKPLDPDVVRAKVAVFVELHRKARLLERLREAEQHRLQTELRDRDAEYQATFEGAPAGIAQLDPGGLLLRANARFCEIFGATWLELKGRPYADLAHPEDREAARSALAKLVRGDDAVDQRVQRCLRKGGGLAYVNRRVSLLCDEAGEPSRFIVVLDDLTERLRAEEGQRLLALTSEVLLSSLDVRAALDSVARLAVPTLADGCAIFLCNETGECDDRGRELVGFAGDAAFARRSRLLAACEPGPLPDLGPGLILPLVARGRDLGAVALLLKPSQRLDARDRAVAEDLAQRVAFAVDNARLYEDAQQAVKLRDEFLSIASHELRTPITPLQLNLQRLLDGKNKTEAPAPERIKSVLSGAQRQVHRLAALVDNLLDVSRITSGKLELNREDVDLGAVVEEIVSRFAEVAERAGSPIEVVRHAAVRGSWDRLRVEQVLTNLVSNAVKYGGGKPVQVEVRRAGTAAQLVVRDHGIGIPRTALGRIFERFERAVSARNYGGLGLGLYISRQIVEAHGGSIGVESEEGTGSAFCVELPLAESRR